MEALSIDVNHHNDKFIVSQSGSSEPIELRPWAMTYSTQKSTLRPNFVGGTRLQRLQLKRPGKSFYQTTTRGVTIDKQTDKGSPYYEVTDVRLLKSHLLAWLFVRKNLN